MRHSSRLLVGLSAALLISGCALTDSRYDNSRLAAGLGDYDESIIDWNFPTSTNQGPLLPPQRFRPFPPAIGVPWATNGEPPPSPNLVPISDARPPSSGSADEAARAPAADADASVVADTAAHSGVAALAPASGVGQRTAQR